MNAELCSYPIYTYVSTKAGYDPAKTYYVCAPKKDAATLEDAARFAQESGWQDAAEDRKSVV